MMGMEQPEDPEAPELSELELSAVSEAMNQMMASAAIAISSVLGTEVEIGTPETRTFTEQGQALDAYPRTPHAVRANFTVCGEPCRLLQLVPNAFVVRMTRALDELGSEMTPPAEPAAPGAPRPAVTAGGRPSLAGIPVRVWAELGRARMPSAQVVGMPAGSVVELNQAADEPIDLYVNGTRFATGRLMVVDGTDWAVRIETVLSSSNTSTESQMEVARWPESW
jgi:flagellar motor switch protein FliN/FliY